MSSRDMEVDGASRRTSTNVTNDSYLPLDDGDVELSDDVRRRGRIARRNTAGEFVSDAGETVLDAIRRPISILVEPELLNLREGYFGVKKTPTNKQEEKDDVESKENESKEQSFDERIRQRLNQRRRRTERKVMGFLPVFLNPDLDESGTRRQSLSLFHVMSSLTRTSKSIQVLHSVLVSDLRTLVIPFHFVIVYIDVRIIRLWSLPSLEVT